MSRRLLGLLALLIALLAPATMPAQPAAGGPAFWTVTWHDSRVFILGTPALTPKNLAWDTRTLNAHLAGANALILPAAPKFDAIKIAALFISNRASFESKGPMEAGLPPGLRTRFVAARARLGQDEGHYSHWKPGVAGLIVAQDFRKAANLAQDSVENAVKQAGRSAHAPQRRPPPFDVMPLFKTFTNLSDQAHLACLTDSLADVEAGSARIQTASAAWARGDVRGAMTAERGYERCLAQVPGAQAMAERGAAETTAVITTQLRTPGKAVAVMPLRQLLDHGGVLERLRALGYTVEGPAL